jgi:hypothetical protein
VYGVREILNQLAVVKRRPKQPGQPSRPSRASTDAPAPGWVVLCGTVESPEEQAEIQQLMAQIPGVVGVVNNLEVSPSNNLNEHPPAADPEELHQITEMSLLQRLERELDNLDIQVANGVVTVSGWVDSWSEKLAVIQALRSAPGVRSVRDALRVDPWSS